jgi:hypothetical protein
MSQVPLSDPRRSAFALRRSTRVVPAAGLAACRLASALQQERTHFHRAAPWTVKPARGVVRPALVRVVVLVRVAPAQRVVKARAPALSAPLVEPV